MEGSMLEQRQVVEAVPEARSQQAAGKAPVGGENPGAVAALLAAKRLKALPCHRWQTAHSAFSALNIDVAPRAPGGSPYRNLKSSMLLELRPLRAAAGQRPCGAAASSAEKMNRQSTTGSEETSVPDSDGELSEVPSSGQEWDDEFSRQATLGGPQYTRKLLLSLRRWEAGQSAPPELANLRAKTAGRPAPLAPSSPAGAQQQEPLSRQVTPKPSASGERSQQPTMQTPPRAVTKSQKPEIVPTHAVSEVSQKRVTPKHARSAADELKRTVQALLNKICPENVVTIAQKIAAVELSSAEQLETVIGLIFQKAVTEPHYCETYADLVFGLKSVFPEFPNPQGGKPIGFKSSVLNICQNAFEEFLTTVGSTDAEKAQYDPEELELCRKARKDRMRANMKFIGHLYLRQLLSAKVIGSVSHELVHGEQPEQLPEEHALECACELLMSIGFTLESTMVGQHVVQQVCSRLLELKIAKTAAGKAAYCKRIQFMIQDLLDTRAAGWAKKTFKTSAKTKDEIRREQERDIRSKLSGQEASSAECVVVGQRPGYLATAIGA